MKAAQRAKIYNFNDAIRPQTLLVWNLGLPVRTLSI
jgi:hypothetical protein